MWLSFLCVHLRSVLFFSVVHLDLMQILVDHVDEETTLKLCDFGLARKNTSTNRQTLLTLRGTYEYAAPEVVGKGVYSGASDIYSVGIILWEMVQALCTKSYQKPFGHMHLPAVAVVVRVMQGVRPPLPGMDVALACGASLTAVSVCLSVSVSVSVYVCMSVCMYVCACACTCVFL
jgi:Protein kinase domain